MYRIQFASLIFLFVLIQQVPSSWALPGSFLKKSSRLPILSKWQGHRGDKVGWLYASSKDAVESISRRNFFLKIGAAFASLPVLLEVYSRFGPKIDQGDLLQSPTSGSWDDIEHATLVFHGSGGQDQYTDDLMKKLLKDSGLI